MYGQCTMMHDAIPNVQPFSRWQLDYSFLRSRVLAFVVYAFASKHLFNSRAIGTIQHIIIYHCMCIGSIKPSLPFPLFFYIHFFFICVLCLFFFNRIYLSLRANCLLSRLFASSVNPYLYWKIRKNQILIYWNFTQHAYCSQSFHWLTSSTSWKALNTSYGKQDSRSITNQLFK